MTHTHLTRWRRRRPATAVIAAAALAAALTTSPSAHAATIAQAGTTVGKPAANLAATHPTQKAALARARATGKSVPVPDATTDTTTVTANPNGTLTLTESALPARKDVNGTWEPLDATLITRPDGSIGPKLSTDFLRLSPGGTGPLATLTQANDSVSVTLPTALPTPALSGDTATYSGIAPGIDLVVTANTQGGFSDVFVVKNHAAATGSALTRLLNAAVTTQGLNLALHNGAITATARTGHAVFSTNGMSVWDSATSAAHTTSALSRDPEAIATSSPRSPGAHAHRGAITPTLSGRTLTLTPDRSVLAGPGTIYPVDIDPTWNPTESAWSTVAQQYPTDQEWNATPESHGYMAVGDGISDASILARSTVNFSLPGSVLSGADIRTAAFSVTNEYSGACPDGAEDEQMDVYAPSQTLSPGNAYWTNWDTPSQLGTEIGSKSFAYGYSTSCSSGGSPSSVTIGLSTGSFASDVTSGKSTQTLALVADNESTIYGWKLLIPSTSKLTLTYDFIPQITSTATNGSNACTVGAPGLIGKGTVDLIAGVYQRNGSSLTTDFRLYNSAKTIEYNPQSTTKGTTSNPSAISATTGTQAVLDAAQFRRQSILCS